jgi:hypothetical protein
MLSSQPYTCRFCGAPSAFEPIDQSAPPDYCHPDDHLSMEDPMSDATPPVINPSQRVLLGTYANGEFAHVETLQQVRDAGDTLFLFLFLELSDAEDCDSLETACARVATAQGQLEDLLAALDRAYVTSLP